MQSTQAVCRYIEAFSSQAFAKAFETGQTGIILHLLADYSYPQSIYFDVSTNMSLVERIHLYGELEPRLFTVNASFFIDLNAFSALKIGRAHV